MSVVPFRAHPPERPPPLVPLTTALLLLPAAIVLLPVMVTALAWLTLAERWSVWRVNVFARDGRGPEGNGT